MTVTIGRRKLLTALGGTAAWPLVARAQQLAMPVVGFLNAASFEDRREYLPAFHGGLRETGYVEGKNVELAYRWANGQNDRLPLLAAELVRLQVAVIVILESTQGALSAKVATQTIPIVFMQGADPVGLVRSLNRPGGNLTGLDLLLSETAAKRLELLLQTVPTATLIGYLRNPTNPVFAETETREVQVAARTLGVRLLLLDATGPQEIDSAFATVAQERANALMLSGDGLLNLRYRDQIIELAAKRAVPTMYVLREAALAGGLMSYGLDQFDAWKQAGVYTGRILKGERPADLPVQRVTKVQFVINLGAAKALGLTFPIPLLGRADEVIE